MSRKSLLNEVPGRDCKAANRREEKSLLVLVLQTRVIIVTLTIRGRCLLSNAEQESKEVGLGECVERSLW